MTQGFLHGGLELKKPSAISQRPSTFSPPETANRAVTAKTAVRNGGKRELQSRVNPATIQPISKPTIGKKGRLSARDFLDMPIVPGTGKIVKNEAPQKNDPLNLPSFLGYLSASATAASAKVATSQSTCTAASTRFMTTAAPVPSTKPQIEVKERLNTEMGLHHPVPWFNTPVGGYEVILNLRL